MISINIGATASADVFKILGVIPSRPVAFVSLWLSLARVKI